MSVYQRFIKRALDLLIAATGLIVVSPLLAVVAVAIRLEDGAPVIFRQERVGRDNQLFTVYKFRSMPLGTPSVPSLAARDLHVTRVGRFIRRTNIDELPQLLNVVRGDMSLIGPRPALPSQVSLVEARTERGVMRIRPGLTGLAQVNSYDGMPESEKLDWDSRYAARISFLGDVAIVLRTVAYLSKRPPVY